MKTHASHSLVRGHHGSNEIALYLDHFQSNFEQESAAFRGMFSELLNSYSGMFVALCAGKVIDKDKDELSLVKRVSQLPKDKFILVQQVIEDEAAPEGLGKTGRPKT